MYGTETSDYYNRASTDSSWDSLRYTVSYSSSSTNLANLASASACIPVSSLGAGETTPEGTPLIRSAHLSIVAIVSSWPAVT